MIVPVVQPLDPPFPMETSLPAARPHFMGRLEKVSPHRFYIFYIALFLWSLVLSCLVLSCLSTLYTAVMSFEILLPVSVFVEV